MLRTPNLLCLFASLVASGAGWAEESARRFGDIPLNFEPNTGQASKAVKYFSRGPQNAVLLCSDRAIVEFSGNSGARGSIQMEFLGASPRLRMEAIHKTEATTNYLLGNDPQKWRTNIANYSRVIYHDVYPGIDVVFYGNHGQFEYDVLVHPEADASRVRFGFPDVTSLRLNGNGDLVLEQRGDELMLHRPRIYQEIDGVVVPVKGSFALLGESEIGFKVESYDRSRPLIIDPVLSFVTTFGGTTASTQIGRAIALDSAGNIYITGATSAANFPTLNPYQTFQGTTDAFVIKLNPTGTQILYSTYLGGADDDRGLSIAVDTAGFAYVAGTTRSGDFPTSVGGFVNRFVGNDVFVTKLNATGSAFSYSLAWGGFSDDQPTGISVNAAGEVYVCGSAQSADFPTTVGAYQTSSAGGLSDVFVTKLNAGGAIQYSTLIGTNRADYGSALTVDSSGSAYITGYTYSTVFPTTPGAFQTTPPLNPAFIERAFVAKLNSSGSALVFSTYLSGSDSDVPAGISLDGSQNVYVTGTTLSADFPAVPGSLRSMTGWESVFVSKLNAAGSALMYSAVFGGSKNDRGAAISVDSAGRAFVVGLTASADFPISGGAFQAIHGSGSSIDTANDAFVVRLSPSGDALQYSSLLGGLNDDYATGLAIDASGNAYVLGNAYSANFPRPLNSSQFGPSPTMFLAKVEDNPGCVFSLGTTSADFGISAASSNVAVTATGGCPWVSVSPAAWIAVSNPSGQGNGTATVSADANISPARSAIISIAGRPFTVSQPNGCVYVLSSSSSNFTASGGNGSFTVDHGPNCPTYWTNNNPDWITFWGSLDGVHFSYSVQPYAGSTSRTGSVTIEGKTFTITQGIVPCSYSLSPQSVSVGSDAFSGSFNVIAPSSCTWIAFADLGQNWLNSTNGDTRQGNGTVQYDGPANPNPFPRSANITVAGQVFTVTQAAPVLPTLSLLTTGGSAAVQTFTATYGAANGFSDLRWVQMLFAVAADGGGQPYCLVHYDVQANRFWLYGDGGFFVGPVAPGVPSNLLQNSLCALNAGASSATGSGTALNVSLSLVFKAAGGRVIYMRAQNLSGGDTGWKAQGNWFLASAALGVPSIAPASGSGAVQTFTLAYPDPQGFAGSAFGWAQFLVAAAPDGGGQPFCFVHYDRAGNGLWMYSSDVGFFLGPVTPGTASNALNSSACSVNTAGATISNTSGNLVVSVPITLKAPMNGAKTLYMRTLDVLNRDSGWAQRGTWTVQ